MGPSSSLAQGGGWRPEGTSWSRTWSVHPGREGRRPGSTSREDRKLVDLHLEAPGVPYSLPPRHTTQRDRSESTETTGTKRGPSRRRDRTGLSQCPNTSGFRELTPPELGGPANCYTPLLTERRTHPTHEDRRPPLSGPYHDLGPVRILSGVLFLSIPGCTVSRSQSPSYSYSPDTQSRPLPSPDVLVLPVGSTPGPLRVRDQVEERTQVVGAGGGSCTQGRVGTGFRE